MRRTKSLIPIPCDYADEVETKDKKGPERELQTRFQGGTRFNCRCEIDHAEILQSENLHVDALSSAFIIFYLSRIPDSIFSGQDNFIRIECPSDHKDIGEPSGVNPRHSGNSLQVPLG